MDLWQGLVDGRWFVFDRFDKEGRRFIVVRRNGPTARGRRGLSPAERRVACYASWGHSQKLIAQELGLSEPAVSIHLVSALRKIGLRHRSELAALPPGDGLALPAPRGLAAHTFEAGNHEFLVLSFDLATIVPPSGLTRSESDVVRAVAEGLSTAEIATRRGTSRRTVTNQLSSVFSKLGVSSRAELVLKCARGAAA